MLEELYQTIQRRDPPEVVVRLVLQAKDWHPRHKQLLKAAAREHWYTYMRNTFHVPVHTSKAPATLADILGREAPTNSNDPVYLHGLISLARRVIGLKGEADFAWNRMDREQLHVFNPNLGWRQYKRLYRLVIKLEREVAELEEQQLQSKLFQVAKSAFASDLTWEDFSADSDTAMFVAYLTANMNRRSIFTSGPQARAFDEIAQVLLDRAMAGTPNYYAMAHVFPRNDILAGAGQSRMLDLLAAVTKVMDQTALQLREAAKGSNMDLDRLVVKKGDDSSTWNELAGAWNKARDWYLALMSALGMDHILDNRLPGKVMRLMAADVVYGMHGGQIHPDTAVFAVLPKPWEVMFNSGVDCSREMMEFICQQYGVDPEKSGWTKARARTAVEPWSPTPDLVHGVVVNHPELAAWLREIGAFSGYGLNWSKIDA